MTQGPKREAYDVVVVGAGPAGMAAAATTAGAGLSTLLLDENAGPGGQVWRAITSTPIQAERMLGKDYWDGRRLVEEVKAAGAEILAGATVWSLDRHREVGISVAGGSRFVSAGRVILATGALERPFPIPGWTLPGVMTAGAAQTLLKSSGLVPNGRTVIAGQGPLLWLLAAQIMRMGGRIDLVLDTTARRNYLDAYRHAIGFITSPYFLKGLAMMTEVRRKTRVIGGVTELVAAGDGRVQQVTYTASGRSVTVPVDLLLLHQGVIPNVNLAMAAGVRHRWDKAQLCFTPILDGDGQTSVEGVAIAGDGAGIGGVWVAVQRGRIAGRAAANALAPEAAATGPSLDALRGALAKAERGRAFLDVLFRPAKQFRIPSGDTIVCRCEEVTAADVLESVAIGATGPNQLKAYRRTGMGPCQGRLCGLTVTELMAEARGKSPDEIGYYRLRAPVKPITLAELASASEIGNRNQSCGAGMTLRADAIVIGGGIHGCSTALHLCMRGLKPVLIERDHAGRHASGVNAGGVRQLARHVAEIPLSIRSMDVWETVRDLVGDDCGFDSYGQVLVAENEEELEACRERVSDLNLRGFTHEELIDGAELRRLVPAVAETCPGGVVSRRDGAANPAQTTTAFRRKAEELGAIVREGETATNPRREGGVWRVDASGETIEAPVLVNAAGAWGGAIAAALGEPVPVETVAPMLMITSHVPTFIKPVVILRGRKLSFKQFANGTVLIGGGHLATPDLDTHETILDWRKLQESARTVFELFPVMRQATIVRAWAGIEARMRDDLPVIGPSAKHEGLYHQFGFSLHGFQLGPGTGAVMAELIATGHTNTPIDGLRIERFAT